LEYLETQGVVVGAFADGRNGHVDFPVFFTRDSGIKAPKVIQDEMEAAAIICKGFVAYVLFLCVSVFGIISGRCWQRRLSANAFSTAVAQLSLRLSSGLLFANPIPSEHSIPKAEMDAIIAQAVNLADTQGIYGSDNTPFILNKIKELSGGRTVKANKALVEYNVERGTKVAVELAKLEVGDRIDADR
jgi:pseudouridine-5'-phosphate glycosidase/pseudouridine-5'-phosphate glycosidase/pseudouridine kinase